MQTQREFDASIRVLEALRKPQSSTIVTTWDDLMQRAYVGLSRMGYVETRGDTRARGSFKWNTIGITPLGETYLSQIKSAPRSR